MRGRTYVKLIEPLPIDAIRGGLSEYRARDLTILQLLSRDGERCYVCGTGLEAVSFEIDHVIARRHGGTDNLWNLALACSTCNRRKRDLVIAFTIADRRPFFLLP